MLQLRIVGLTKEVLTPVRLGTHLLSSNIVERFCIFKYAVLVVGLGV